MEVYLSMDKERLDKKPKEGLAIAEVKTGRFFAVRIC